MDDLKYRVEELELDGDDLRRRVSELEQDVESLDDPGDFDDLEYRVEKLEGADAVDHDDFDALERSVEKLATDLRARFEKLEFETRAAPERVFVEIDAVIEYRGVSGPFKGRFVGVYQDGNHNLKRFSVEEDGAREVLRCEFSRTRRS